MRTNNRTIVVVTAIVLGLLFGYTRESIAQDFPDTITEISGESKSCKVSMINNQSVFAQCLVTNKKGKEKPQHETISLVDIKSIELVSSPSLLGSYWKDLINEFEPEFFTSRCAVKSHAYDEEMNAPRSEVEKAIGHTVGAESTWFGVVSLGEEKFIRLKQERHGEGNNKPSEWKTVTFKGKNGTIELAVGGRSSAYDTEKLVVKSDVFEQKVSAVTPSNLVEVLIPISNEDLAALVKLEITDIDAGNQHTNYAFDIDAGAPKEIATLCDCGRYMK